MWDGRMELQITPIYCFLFKLILHKVFGTVGFAFIVDYENNVTI
jgi:hypothetical protein